jgi:hypothetical protein
MLTSGDQRPYHQLQRGLILTAALVPARLASTPVETDDDTLVMRSRAMLVWRC